MPVIVAILAPVQETYTSLQRRAHTLAKDAEIEARYEHARSIDALKTLLQNLNGEHLCLCCDVADGDGYTADDVHTYLAEVWREQGEWLSQRPQLGDWLRQRPLIIITESDDIVMKLQAVARRHPRAHSGVFAKLDVIGTNRWKNIRDAIQEGILNA